jgi:uncharacterized protein (TIGR00255 family)
MPLSSMTGFGRVRAVMSDRLSASVIIRSVNHRYLDIQVRINLREELPELEAAVRAVVAERLERGRVTVQLNLERTAPAGTSVVVDGEAVSGVLEQLREIELAEGLPSKIELGDVLSLPGLVAVTGAETQLDEAEMSAFLRLTVEAVEQLRAMRLEEGGRLEDQLHEELGRLAMFLDWFEAQVDDIREKIHERLRERIARLLGPETHAEPERLVQEAALMADKSEVAEEIVRLRSHLAKFSDKLASGGAVGRTLDFLCQEIHRELNTLGSKCREVGVADRLVEAKTATERLREQVQNLE